VVALNLLFELLPLRLRVGRAAYWCRLCPNARPNQTPGGGAAQVGNETFWSIGKGESKQAGASPGGAITDGQRASLLVGWFPSCV